ncbi:MAG: histidine phosphatase family protein [Proteobacteria bacterium]|nr:histidine phosphatase family protein [Pseudomonadota bacterium]
MNTPAVTRQRAPFLAPVWAAILTAAVLSALAFAFHRSASSTAVVLVQVAARDAATISDPPLSAEDEERAQRLARVLATHSPPQVLYVSDERGAQQTAAVLAQRLHLIPQAFAAGATGKAAARMLGESRNGAVAAVAGGSTSRSILEELCGECARTAGEEGDVVYVITVPTYGPARVVVLAL